MGAKMEVVKKNEHQIDVIILVLLKFEFFIL